MVIKTTIKKMLEFLYNIFKEPDLRASANLSEEKVIELAQEYGEEKGWLTELHPKTPHIEKEWGSLFWTVYFDEEGEDHRFNRGGNIFIVIDDETAKVIKECVQTR